MKKALCKVSIIPLIICLIFSIYQSTAFAKLNDASIKDVKISCGVLDPEFNSEKTKYTLYIPSDLTQIIITPTASSQNATANKINLTLSEMQEPTISITCKAESGNTQKYTFKIKRIDKTVSEIEKEISKNGYAAYINKSKFYQQTDFLICLGTVLAGIIILTLLYLFFRKKLIKPYDESEEPFYLAD